MFCLDVELKWRNEGIYLLTFGNNLVDVRRQRLIAIEEMERELLMDYDHATRYYYMTV